ncbi:MAG TPA: DsbE family thiol:disulfide interchange protein [Gallionellaceae bacterium]|nr:DsbE family thiol:disulfide interchange protein [Gallionellaceae bacterium]
MMRFILPLVIFLALAAFLFKGLSLDPREVPSPLIDKPAPAFILPQLHNPKKQFSPQDMKGKVWMLNVWASWCGSCKDEHPILMDIAQQKIVPVYGLNYKDKREDGLATLRNSGDPYTLVIFDADGKVGFDYGVYGVPETYIIDKQGVIRDKIIGAVTRQNLRERIQPLIEELNKQ